LPQNLSRAQEDERDLFVQTSRLDPAPESRMDAEQEVEVWLTSGKRYCGRIVGETNWDSRPELGGSFLLCEGALYYVWIHAAQILRMRAVPATSGHR
jgi:hypothetical protein